MNPNELFALQIHSLIGCGCTYKTERIASPLLSSPLVVVLQERANACSISVTVSRIPKYPLWLILSLKKIFSHLSSISSHKSLIFATRLWNPLLSTSTFYIREQPWNAVFREQEAHLFPEVFLNLLNTASHHPFAFWLHLHIKQSLYLQESCG